MRYGFLVLSTVLFSAVSTLLANEEIIVTATRIYRGSETAPTEINLSQDEQVITSVNRVVEDAKNSGASFSVITAETMENKLSRSLTDILAGQNGVTIVQDGQSGAKSTIMIRGASSEQTSVMLDGIRLNNPIGAGGGGIFDLSTITPMNLSRVTILRGNNSVLYGSQAMGGAVDIQMKKGAGKMSGELASEFGASGKNLLYRERLATQGGNDKFNFSLSAHYAGSDGSRSNAIADAQGNSAQETDGFWRNGFNSRFGITPTEYLEISLTSLYEFTHAKIDDNRVDALTPYNEAQTILARPKIWVGFFDGLFTNEIGFALLEQKYLNGDNATDTAANFDARSFIGDWQTTIKLPQYSTTTFGAELRFDTGEIYGKSFGFVLDNIEKNTVRQFDVYAQQQLRFFDDDRWVTNFGARLTNHELSGSHATWHADTIFHLLETGTSLKASAGSGFKSPTLFQLYMADDGWGNINGNQNLKPEKSIGGDAGIVQSFFDGKNVSEATYFYNDFTDMITYQTDDPTGWAGWQFQNIGHAITQGVELSNRTRVHEKVTLGMNYTFLDARAYDAVNHNNLLPRRPQHQFSINANVKLCADKVNLNSELVYYGECFDDAANRRLVQSAWAWNLAGSYQATKNLRVYGKLNNILRENYSRAAGYQSDGFGGFVGVAVSF